MQLTIRRSRHSGRFEASCFLELSADELVSLRRYKFEKTLIASFGEKAALPVENFMSEPQYFDSLSVDDVVRWVNAVKRDCEVLRDKLDLARHFGSEEKELLPLETEVTPLEKWEYRFALGLSNDPRQMEIELNELGQRGWELVSTVNEKENTSQLVCFLKRRQAADTR